MNIEDKIFKFLNEGTWNVPSTLNKAKELQKLFNKPILAKNAEKDLYSLIGDDDFFDELDNLKSENPEGDIRTNVAHWLKYNWISKMDPKTGNFKKGYGSWDSNWEQEAFNVLENIIKKWAK